MDWVWQLQDLRKTRDCVSPVENYISGWKGYAGTSFGRFFANSLFMCLMAIIGNPISCTLAAYAFARLKFAGRGFWFAVMMITLMLPAHVTLVPRYILFNTFGWVGSLLPTIVPKFMATDAFFVFLLVQFIRSLPKELDEAATIDGCGKLGVFLRIIVPNTLPALVTVALFTFLWTWDDFFNHLLYLTNPPIFSVSRALRTFVGDAGAVLQTNRGIPSSPVVRQATGVGASKTDAEVYRIYDAVADRTIPQDPNLPNDQEFVNELELIGQQVAYGQSSVDDAAADLQALIERLAVK